MTLDNMDRSADSEPQMPDALDRICQDTLLEVARRRRDIPIEMIRTQAKSAPPLRGFGRALMDACAEGRFGLVGEIKKASPSGGLIRPDFDPARLAKAYAEGGAACLSVLTDGPHFQGSTLDLKLARAAVPLPVLRKDFILDPWQVYESRVMGADCILLIMAALGDQQAIELEQLARKLTLDVLVEVHNRRELDRALGLQSKLIGINARNLKTLKTDLTIIEELAPFIPPDHFVIAESGLRTHEDLLRMSAIDVRACLVGESLMRQPDVAAATRLLLHG